MLRTSFLAALALTAVVALPAAAVESSSNAAVALCRNEVSTQSGVQAGDLRLTQVRDRLASVRVHFNFFRNGAQTGVDCEVSRHQGQLAIASINPPLATATAAAATPATGN